MSSQKQKQRHDAWLNERLMRGMNDAFYDDMYASAFASMVRDGLIVSYVDRTVGVKTQCMAEN